MDSNAGKLLQQSQQKLAVHVLPDLQAGFIDAFVLRNVMRRQNVSLLAGGDTLNTSDAVIAALLGLPPIGAPPFPPGGLVHWMSVKIGQAAANILAVCLAVLVVIGLLITATVMGWTQTAQLLCNTPTMIVEGADTPEACFAAA